MTSSALNVRAEPSLGTILIAGVGNIFLGDDGFGVEVARRMARRALPEPVHVVDFGIRGFDLAYALAGDHDAVILVDATRRGDAPGTLYALELDPDGQSEAAVETHGMDPANVLRLVAALGGRPRRVLLVGCEPSAIDPETADLSGLSAPVESAVDPAIELVLSLVARIRKETGGA
jgi:hydrogenase maturation protease